MKDSLLTEKQKKKIFKSIKEKNYTSIIPILEKIKTPHAGTAKTKDKRLVIREIVKDVIDNSKNPEKDFFNTGTYFCKGKEDVSKEIGISLVWRGYRFNPTDTKGFLLKIADDPNWEVREYAASAFADTLYYNRDFYDDVIEWTKHSSENVRRAVVFSTLGLRENECLAKAFSIFEILMFDNSKYVKKNLGPFILGSYFGNRFPVETLKKLKKWSKIIDKNVKWNVIMSFNNSFGNKYPEDALDILKYFMGDVDLSVNKAVSSTLNFLRKRHQKLVDEFIKTYIMKLVK